MSLDPLSAVVETLKEQQIIPDVIPESFKPTVLFSIIYPAGKEVIQGSELMRNDTLEEPIINFTPMNVPQGSDGNPSYTLVMTDPDAPSRTQPTSRQFRHWVITGLKSAASGGTSDLEAIKTKASTTDYYPPGPPAGSGYHRYIFLLFEEPTGGFTVPKGAIEYGNSVADRRRWDAVKFAEKYGLELVGATYYLVKSSE